MVCSFLPQTRRVGAFVHVMPWDGLQPAIPWFCHFAVPVWYRWGQREGLSSEKNSVIAQFALLPEQLQMGMTMLV
jgi:hypothetical protein